MIPWAAHSLGIHDEVGVRNSEMNSTSERNPSGRANLSGLTRRKTSTTPAAARTAITLRMSRVRRAGKMLTNRSVTAVPIAAGMIRKGATAAIATNG